MQKNITNGKKSILALLVILSLIITMPATVFISRALGGGTAYCSDISPTYINASSDHIELFKIAAQTNYIDGAGAYLDKVYVNFSGAGFSTSDLNPLIDGETAGVSIWVDSDNPNGDGVFNSVPDTMLIPSSIKWIGNQTRVTLPRSSDTQFTEINTNFTFYVIIRTSSTITDNDIIGATIDRIWVNASNATLMGTTTATLTADTISPSVAQNALIAPNSGEKWSGTHTISWDHTRITDSHLLATPVTCYYSSNSGTTWTLIAANEANDGTYSWDTTTAGGDGSNYKVNITAVDGAGKIGYDISNATFQIDNTLPGCTIAFNRSSTYLKDGAKLKIFANFTEGESGVDESTVKISIDTTGDGDLTNHSMSKASNTHWYYDWTVPSGSDDDGVFTVEIWAQDNASNYLSPYPATDNSKNIDNTAPSVSPATMLSPDGGEKWSGTHSITWVTVGISDIHLVASPITLSYSNDGGGSWTQIATGLANSGSYSWSTMSVSNGSNYLIRILAVDLAGNSGYDVSNVTFVVDNTAPVCAIAYNQSVLFLKDGMKLKVFANFTEGSAGMDEASVRISIDTAGNGSLANVSMVKSDNTHWFYGWVVPAGSDDDGTVAVRVWGQDNASNYLNPYPTTDSSKNIDNIVPTCAISYNRSATYLKAGDTLKIYANFSEIPSGINPITVMINISTAGNGRLANTTMSQTNNLQWFYDWTIPSGSDDDGVFTVKIWAQDNASNYLNPYPTFDGSKTIDNTAPSVSSAVVLSPNGYEAWSGMHSILWASDDITDLHFVANPITLFYSNNGGGSWNQIASLLANNGSYSWNTTSVPDGSNYLMRILAVDLAGNIGYDISNATFTVDNTVPVCSIVYNRSVVYLKDGMKLKVFANFTEGSAGMDEASVRISIDTAGNGSLANVSMVKSDNTHWFYGWVVPAGSDDDGTVAVRVWGQDNASNYLNPYPTINTIKIIDNTAPDCSIEYNLSKTFFNVGDAIKIYANFTETESGINESSVKINIDTAGNGGLANTSMVRTNNTDWYYGWTIPAGSDDDGAFTVKIWAHDNISNYVNPYPTTNAIKKIDNTRPICTIAYNRSALTFKAGTKLKIYANFTELGSGINPSSVIIGITTAGDGAQSPIAMSQTNNTRWYYSWTIPSGSDDDGVFTVSIWASDNESNQLNPIQTTDSSKLIDNTAPICTIAYNRSATYFKEGDKLKIYVNFTEFDSGMDESSLKISFETVGNGDLANTSMTKIDDTHYNYEWTIPAGSDDDGAVTVRVWAKDNASNLLSPYPTTSTTKQIDNTAPSVPPYALKFPNGGEQISGIQTIAWGNGDISDSHLAASPITLFYSNNGGGSWVQIATGEANDGEYSLNVGTLADGSNYKINVLAADQAGNTANDTSNATFTIDNTNPTCSISYNQSGIYFMEGSNLKIYANFTEADSGINDSSVRVSITTIGNGGLANTSMVKTDSTHWYYDWTVPSGSDDDGVFTVKIWAHDNVSKALIPWPTTDSARQIDNTAPLISSAILLTPNGGEMWSGTHSLTWVSGDITDSHLAASPITLFYSNNGGASWVQITTGEANDGEYSLNVGTLADGSNYKINVLAADQAGNVANDTSNETFTIDNTPPTCSIGYNRTETSFKQGTTIKIFANFTEITSGMNETMIQINISTSGNGGLSNTTLHRISNTQWYYNWTIPSEVDDDGTFIVKIYAKDNTSNNLDTYPTINTAKQIDNTAPTSALNAIISHYHDTSTYLTITASASDVLSGLDTVSLFFYNSTDNFTWAGPYRYAINATPWNGVSWHFSFLSTNNSGYYRFYSEAADNATNIETAPITNDTWCLYNFTNSPPNASKNPSPAIGATDVSISITLSWMSGGDPDENTVTYDVYFGTDSTPDATELKIRNQTTTSYNPGTLSYGITYYWLIISRDNHSIGTVGPIWSFNTATAPQNPGGEYISYPGNIRPVADVGDFYSGYLNETITFNGSKSKDSDGSIVGYRWDFTNDSIYDTAWLTSAIITHTYTHIGTYRLKLQVKDNENTTDDDTATITIKPHPFINVSQDSITQIKNTFGLHLTTPFYATDNNGDGIVDTFIDPNHLLTLVRFVNINENASFLLSTGNDMIPEFFWDTKANKTVPLTFIPVLMTETWINPEAQEILIIADVEKSEWVYLKIIDPYPPDKYQNFTLTVKTTDDRIISSNMIWRENGNIFLLDDSSVQYIFTYGYTLLPPVLNPPDGTILNTARPTITIAFLEETILTSATLENNNILDQLTTIDHKTYIFTPPSDLVDGTYTLRLTVQDNEGNTLTSTSTYTISIVKIQTGEIPWLILIFIAIIFTITVILVILRRRLIF